jgi:formylglycine-generating enzyme required for sulfatase activity
LSNKILCGGCGKIYPLWIAANAAPATCDECGTQIEQRHVQPQAQESPISTVDVAPESTNDVNFTLVFFNTAIIGLAVLLIIAVIWLGTRMFVSETPPVATNHNPPSQAGPSSTGEQPTENPTEQTTESITNTIGMTLNLIPAGTCLMGSPEDETDKENNEHQYFVRIVKAFYMQTTEVTQGQWKAVMDTEPWKDEEYVKDGANYAATYVSWDDAIAYCNKLSAKEGNTYRLPTEAEWEYACRAGTEARWSFGDDKNTLGDYAWYNRNAYDAGEEYAHQVGLKNPNAFGLYDMHGNVWEWCYDYYGEAYYKQSPEKDPQGPTSGSSRVFRGGTWLIPAHFTRSAFRGRSAADLRTNATGFRLVRELD